MSLIPVTELAALRDGDRRVRVLDVRWSLPVPDGRADFESGHIPGAVYADLDTELSDHTVTGRGRHPLPDGTELQEALRRWGIDDGDIVVAYDDWHRAGSARAWWVLRAAGLSDVRILDGGWSAWRAAGLPVETGPATPEPGTVTVTHHDLYAGAMPTLTADEAAALAGDGVLVDARAPERFRGESEPVDPVAGHVPGARNLPSTSLLGPDGAFLPPERLRALFTDAGFDAARSAGAYCGSGVTAAVVLAAAESAGFRAALFPGSWSQWSSDPTRPVETGPGA